MPDERHWLKREASWLYISLFESLRTLAGILFGLTVLWFREEIMLETSLQSVGEVQKWITKLLVGGSQENCFFYI